MCWLKGFIKRFFIVLKFSNVEAIIGGETFSILIIEGKKSEYFKSSTSHPITNSLGNTAFVR